MEKQAFHYRQFLERELESRQRKNRGYSIRAFARDTGIQPSKMSEVLRGIRGLSKSTAMKIARKIGLSEHERDVFLNLIDAHQNKNLRAKKKAEENLQKLATVDEYGELSLERFKIISDWQHFAILELTEVEDFESNPSWIAGRLGISTKTAMDAIERLLDFGLLKKSKTGDLKQTHANLATPSGIPSRELKEHHSQILMRADAALTEVDLVERDFSAITLAFNQEQMGEIRGELKKLRRSLGQRIQEQPQKSRVYCLSIQFFPLDRKNQKSNMEARR